MVIKIRSERINLPGSKWAGKSKKSDSQWQDLFDLGDLECTRDLYQSPLR